MSKLFSTVITICTTLDCLKNSIELSVPPKLNLCEHDQKSTYNPKHNKDGDCWIAVNNKVYDLSKFAMLHPGGAGVIRKVAG